VAIVFDPAKRAQALAERGVDFADAGGVIDGEKYQFVDNRFDYGEERITTIGMLDGAWWWSCGRSVATIATSFRCERPMPVNSDGTRPNGLIRTTHRSSTDAWFDKADFMIGDTVIRRGRPPGSTKRLVSLRLDKAVLEHFRATARVAVAHQPGAAQGGGAVVLSVPLAWQGRIEGPHAKTRRREG
jgi:uncharacterized DUF497 family protein